MPARASKPKKQQMAALMASKPIRSPGKPSKSKEEALTVARRRFMARERIDAGEIAKELGVDRATIFRWFRGRDVLLIETLWALCRDEMIQAEREAKGSGIEWMIDGLRLFVSRIAEHKPYQHFLRTEPEAAARALFTAEDSIRQRIIRVATELARKHGGILARHLDPEPLAMAVVRVGEAFLYGDHLGNGVPNVGDLIKIYRLILLPGQLVTKSGRNR